MAARIELGAFELRDRLGKGGMAEVWSGVHIKEQVPVAIKIVTEPDIRRPQLHASLRNEVRAMARLEHPNVVMVFDYGEVSAEVEQASAGALAAGSPYLVMELAEGGTALPLCGKVSWRRVREILVSLLDGLAHAHARGVIHRDVKPSNILVFDDGVRISDFGLALDLEPEAVQPRRRGRVLGTPAYMAPEQFVGDFREYGPATDLYAVGCVAYSLAAGGPPYGRASDLTLMYELHLEAVIPPLEPRMPVPDGLEGWVEQLLQKKPSRRFPRAADALQALGRLGDPKEGIRAPLVDDPSTGDDALSSSVVTVNAEMSDAALSSRSPFIELESIPPPTHVPPFPKSWRNVERPRPPMGLVGAGLGLYGVRSVPLVARERERDQLWQTLRTVSEKRDKRMVLLDGPAGCGKSRLAQWLCEHAHESGVAEVLRAVHSPRAGPLHGLAPMIARYLGTEGLERPGLTEHIRRRLGRLDVRDDADVEALAELVAPDAEDSVDRSVRFSSSTERYVLVARLARRISRFRPVVMLLEDAHNSLDAVAFAQHLMFLEKSQNFPLLLLLTARSEVLAAQPERARQLAACGAHPGASSLRVDPLPSSEWPRLVERLLRLEPDLAERVADRTRGNPLFAVQLVGHWVDRGLLEARPGGFGLVEGATAELPDALHAMWLARIERLLAGRSLSDAVALEIAAMLGEVVEVAEWQRACGIAGLSASGDLLEALIARGLASAGERGPSVSWSFVHGLLRESLERRAGEGGRATSHHQSCAQMLSDKSGTGVAERVARHLRAAGELERALAPLRDAAEQRLETGDYVVADTLLTEREEILLALRRDEADVHWAEGWILRGRLAMQRGSFESGMKWATLSVDAAREHCWQALLAQGLLLRGRLERMHGDAARAEPDLREAEQLARSLNDAALVADTLEALGRVLMHKGQLDQAEGCMLEAVELCRNGDDRRAKAVVAWALAHLLSYRERYDEAFDYNHEALQVMRSCGDRWGTGRCLNTAGEIARLRGLLEDAELYYRSATDVMRAIGSSDSVLVCESNVARVQAQRGAYVEARATLERNAAAFGEHARLDPLAWSHCVLLICDAGQGDWGSWDAHIAQARSLLGETGYLDLDIATSLELAAARALEAGELARARDGYALSSAQWKALGREQDAARVQGALARAATP